MERRLLSTRRAADDNVEVFEALARSSGEAGQSFEDLEKDLDGLEKGWNENSNAAVRTRNAWAEGRGESNKLRESVSRLAFAVQTLSRNQKDYDTATGRTIRTQREFNTTIDRGERRFLSFIGAIMVGIPAVGALAGGVGALTGGIVALSAALASLSAVAVIIPAALAAIGAAIAAIVTIIAPAIGGIKEGVKAVEEMRDATTEGAVDDARRIADAEEALAEARENGARRIQEAERDLARARRDGSRDIADAEERLAEVILENRERELELTREIAEARREATKALQDMEADIAKSARDRAERELELEERLAEVIERNAQRLADAQERLTRLRRQNREQEAEAEERLAEVRLTVEERVRDAEERLRAVRANIAQSQRQLEQQLADARASVEGARSPEERALAEAMVREAEGDLSRFNDPDGEAQRRLRDAEEDLARTRIEGADDIADAEERLAKIRRDNAEQEHDAEEGIQRLIAEGIDSERDAREALAKFQRDSAEAEIADQERLAEVRARGVERIRNLERRLAETRKEGAERASDAETRLSREREQLVDRIAEAERRLAEARRDSADAIEDAAENLARSMSDAGGASDETMRKWLELEPIQRRIALQWVDMKERWGDLVAGARQRWYETIERGLNVMDKNLPAIAAHLTLFSDAMRRVVDNGIKMAQDPVMSGRWSNILKDGAVNLEKMGNSLLTWLGTLSIITDVARPFINWMVDGIVAWGEWIRASTEASEKTGALAGFFEFAKGVLSDFLGIISDVARFLLELGKIGAPFGAELLSELRDFTDRIRDFSMSTEGKAAFKEFFENTIPVFRELVKLLADVGAAFFRIGERLNEGGEDSVMFKLLNSLRLVVLPRLEEMILRVTEDLLPALIPFIEAFVDWAATTAEGLAPALAGLARVLTVVFDALAKLGPEVNATIFGGLALARIFGLTGPLTKAMGEYANKAIAWVLKATWNLIASLVRLGVAWFIGLGPIGWIIAGIALLVGIVILLDRKFHFIRPIIEAVGGAFQWLGEKIMDILGPALDWIVEKFTAIIDWFPANMDRMKGIFMIALQVIFPILAIVMHWDAIVDAVKGIFNRFIGWFAGRKDAAVNALRQVWDAIKNAVPAAWEAIKDAVGSGLERIWEWIKGRPAQFVTNMELIWDAVKNAIPAAWDRIKGAVVSAFNSVKQWFIDNKDFLADAIGGVWNSIKEGVPKAWRGIIETIENWINKLIDGINWLLGKLKIPELDHVDIKGGIPGRAAGAINTPGQQDIYDPVPGGLYRVAEAGHPEAVISLDPRYRDRSLAIVMEVLRRMGVKDFARGGFVQGSTPPANPFTLRLAEKLFSMGFNVTSGYRASSGTWHGDSKFPGGAALDFGDSANNLQRLWNMLFHVRQELEEFMGPTFMTPGGGLYDKGQQFYDARTQAIHQDHIHMVALKLISGFTKAFASPEEEDSFWDKVKSGAGSAARFAVKAGGKVLRTIGDVVGHVIPDLPKLGEGVMASIGMGLLKKLKDGVTEWVRDKAKGLFGMDDEAEQRKNPAGWDQTNMGIGRALATQFGWDEGRQWEALQQLWGHESGWRTTADNPTSDAYGIPQALPGSKMSSAGADWATNPATQIKWGLGYIKGRYGNPARAWEVWQERQPHWYDVGGEVLGGALGDAVGIVAHVGEWVLNPSHQAKVAALLGGYDQAKRFLFEGAPAPTYAFAGGGPVTSKVAAGGMNGVNQKFELHTSSPYVDVDYVMRTAAQHMGRRP